MRDTELDAFVDELADLSAEERATWWRERPELEGARADIESVLAHYDRVIGDADALPDPLSGLRASSPVRAPERIGPYTVLDTLGAGGMGVVYLAEQPEPKRLVAVKLVHAALLNGDARRRFEQEAELLARLQHPGIAQVIELGRGEGGETYLVMEHIEGERITTWVAERGLDRDARLALLAQLADAVHHAHLRGVVHRDLKPANVLVTDAGQVKVIDFGVARALDGDATRRTRAGQVVGTLAYMSPEQLGADPDAVDARADIYALGVLAYEVLGGRLPHDLETASLAHAARVLVEQEPPPLGRVEPGCRGDVELVVGKALAKEPARRYVSAAAFAADLRRVLEHQAVEARAPTLVYQLGRLARRHRGLFAGAAVAILAVVLGGGLAWDQALRNRDLARDEADARGEAEREAARATAEAAAAETARREAERARADTEAALLAATQAQAEAERARLAERMRVEELESVVGFQADRLGETDLRSLGGALRARLLDALQTGLADRGHAEDEVAERRRSLEAQLAEIDLTGLAGDSLWEDFLEPSRALIASDYAEQPAIRARLLFELGTAAVRLDRTGPDVELLDEAWRLFVESRGPNDALTLEAQVLLARAHGSRGDDQLGDTARARELLEAAREPVLEVFGEGSAEAAILFITLADGDTLHGDSPAARANLKRAVHAGRQILAAGHPRATALLPGALRRLGQNRALAGDVERALPLLEEAYALVGEDLSRDGVVARLVQADLGGLLSVSGRQEEAYALLEPAHEGLARSLGRSDPMTLRAHEYRATVLAILGRLDEAEPLMAELVALRRTLASRNPSRLFQAEGVHAEMLRLLGRLDDARALLEPLEQRTRVLPPTHSLRVDTLQRLRETYADLEQARPGEGWGAKADAVPASAPPS